MRHQIHKEKSLAIVYDSTIVEAPLPEIFSVDYWNSKQALTGEAVGRGSAWFINSPFGPVVLRHYLRGGWIAKISRRSYLFSTLSRSRPFREYHLLESLYGLGLPVPQPVAALCEFHGVVSTGALITAQIPSARTLADVLPGDKATNGIAQSVWENIGRCIRRFHNAGVWHADLNARNILLDADLDVFLIDFDRARFTPGKAVNGQGNLKRLKRSLLKNWPAADEPTLPAAWKWLKAGYGG